VWESSFEPYLDPTQWPEYYGLDYVPDLDLLKTKKGRRKKKRLIGVMDASNGYDEAMYGFGDFDEALGQVHCSKCHTTGHTTATHKKRKKSKKGTLFIVFIPSSLFYSHFPYSNFVPSFSQLQHGAPTLLPS
jgi:hypothetical protein